MAATKRWSSLPVVSAWSVLLGTLVAVGQASDGVWPGEQWQAAALEEARMDSAKLAQARDYALANEGSGLIVRHGKVVLSWGDQDRTYDLKSSTKAIGVTAVGLALSDGKFQSLNEPAVKYQPDLGVPPETNKGKGWIEK
ncbi:MAG: hypothetical protein ABFE01_27800, partial [Phycisphaerales bacterium]